MPSRIDDNTMLPLSMVAALFTIGVSITATGAFWVSQVNDRLARIEGKLGIADQGAVSGFFKAAQAKEGDHGPTTYKK